MSLKKTRKKKSIFVAFFLTFHHFKKGNKNLLCHTSYVMCHVSCVTCNLSPVTSHLSPVTCHLSLVTCHLSPATCHLSLSQQPEQHTLPLLTLPLWTVGWNKKLKKEFFPDFMCRFHKWLIKIMNDRP